MQLYIFAFISPCVLISDTILLPKKQPQALRKPICRSSALYMLHDNTIQRLSFWGIGTHCKHVSIQPGWLLVLLSMYIYQSARHKVEASWWPFCPMFSNLAMVFMVTVSITANLLITHHPAEANAQAGHCGSVSH